MDLAIFNREELVAVVRALRDVAHENGVFTEAERDLVEGVAQLHGVEIDAQALEPIAPAELARALSDPHKRKRAVQLALVTSLVEGAPGPKTERAVAELARALDVPEAGLRVLSEIVDGQITLARFDMVRRLGRALLRGQRLGALFTSMIPVLGIAENESVAARYRGLGELPDGTLGRTLHDHLRENGFALPGEKNAMPERGVFHDVGHVLSGYDVDPAGEIQQAAFQAGFMRNDGFTFFLFGILQFHLGIKLTPVAEGERGFFDVKRVLRAAHRGAACNVDLSSAAWDFWSIAEVPLDELRARYGVPPA